MAGEPCAQEFFASKGERVEGCIGVELQTGSRWDIVQRFEDVFLLLIDFPAAIRHVRSYARPLSQSFLGNSSETMQ